jgi:hypothetical protein
MANSFGWGNTCLPYTQAELTADAKCIADATLTDPGARAIYEKSQAEFAASFPDAARCIEQNPRLTWAFGSAGCAAGDVLDKTGVPPVGWLVIGAVAVVLLLRK